MAPEHLRFGGGASGTLLHPLVAVLMVAIILLILCLPRKHVVGFFLAGVFLIPLGQVVVVGGIHFTVLRILILAGLARRAISPRGSGAVTEGFKSLDPLVSLWFAIEFTASALQFRETQAIIKGLGDFLDGVGGYFVLRFLIQNREDVQRAIKACAVITMVSGCCMLNEQLTHQNIFGLLGGVPLFPQVREGRLRSQAAFGIYLDAGVFGAILVPLFVWLWSEKSRGFAGAGIAGGLIMMITSNSSTPLLALFGGIVGLGFWHLREWMRQFRWGFSLMLIGLHLVMNGPVWALIARVDLTGSSSGEHRYALVDATIRHFSDWWLMGYKDYPNWGWDMWDLSNLYVGVALTGGLAALVVFIRVLSRSFGGLGTARKRVRGDLRQEWFLWCLGATLLAHVVAWFGCSYLAQMQIFLFMLLAMITVAVSETMRATVKQPAAPDHTHPPPFWPQSDELQNAVSS